MSSTTTNGGLGSADLADVFCQEAANGAGHTGTFRAVVSGDLDPAINRLVISGPVVNALGEEVASDATQFWSGSLSASVGLNEFGVPVATNVHTGTTATGDEHMLNCQSWTSSGGASARVGVSTATDGRWLDDSSLNCNTVLPMYCLRQ